MHENLAALARAILEEQPPPLLALRADVDPMLAGVIERAMARDPAWRFENAHAMRAALSGQEPMTVPARPATRVMDAPLPPPPTFAPVGEWSWRRRNRKALGIGAVVAAFLLATILLIFNSPFQSRPPEPATTSTPVTAPPPPPPPPTTTTMTPSPEPPPPVGPPEKKGGKGHGHGHGGD